MEQDHETTVDHPLNLNPDSQWNNYFKDNEVLAQIDKDVRRLCPEIDFFQRITAYPHRTFRHVSPVYDRAGDTNKKIVVPSQNIRSAAKINLSCRIRQENLYSEVPPNSHFSAGNVSSLHHISSL
ncbi:hypothetical protein WUBG_18022 [Wuchereria bancrofti]|uniref:Uncharacterized protein n=1 Tax=Wuchereria bancrofti TaxID=6293 RepID=J9E6W7_WUCBA|nr:hypothetical protein WUBG_18022 [Wuchereria bancrofti]